ncbi:MAG: hypothetical protein JSU07_02855 [Bacteroidetes bacterium]|nr:hypothetical protein [Bacteroidota bacterium]
METNKENNQSPPPNNAAHNIPEWVMHLLTGLGTMGAEYMLFIKPLQEKMELQTKLIKEQGERIETLEELLQNKRKIKRPIFKELDDEEDEQEDDNDDKLFNIKRKPFTSSKTSKPTHLRL